MLYMAVSGIKIMLYRLKFNIAVDTLMEQHLVWD